MGPEMASKDASDAGAEPIALEQDHGFSPRYFWAGLLVGLMLFAAGVGLALLDAAARIYPLTMCIGFGLVLAAFGTRAVVRGGKDGGVGIVAGAGAVAVALYAAFVWLTPEPPAPVAAPIKKIEVSGDLDQVTSLRLIDDGPLFSRRTDDARSYKFVMLDAKVASQILRMVVDTREATRETFEMRADRAVIEPLLGESADLNWRLNYAAQTVTDHRGRVLFRSFEELDEMLLGAAAEPRRPGLGLIGAAHAADVNPVDVVTLIEDLRAEDTSVRRLARDRLAAAGPSAVPALMAALAADPGDYRLRLGVTSALNAMLRRLPADAAAVAGHLDEADLDRLVAAVGDPDKTIRLYATEFLYQLRDPRSVTASLRVLEGQEAGVAPADQNNAAYNSLLVIKSASGKLPPDEQARIADSIDQAVPRDALRTRGLAEQVIEQSSKGQQ